MQFTSLRLFTTASAFLIDCLASEVKCDLATQEICYSENYYPVSCANITDGGCDCPQGQVKCGAFNGYAGYCTPVCCDFLTEDTCYNETTAEPSFCAKISEGGCPCPPDQIRCGVSDFSIGYCTDVCCDWTTEETCYNATAGTTTCVPIVQGGCSGCKNGQIKCGETEHSPGYCADFCCDPLTEETCYDENLNPRSCAPIGEGCPCPEGKSRCGAFEGFPGLCTSLCCDSSSEETCYNENWEPLYCAKFSEGGCPCPANQTKCGTNNFDPGYCTDVCCDLVTEETCYNSTSIDDSSSSYCAKISEGGCPCHNRDEVKCGASEYYAGYCTRVCCDWRVEQACLDKNNEVTSCARYDEGGCPNNDKKGIAAWQKSSPRSQALNQRPSETSYFGVTWLDERGNKQLRSGSELRPLVQKPLPSGLESYETKPSPKRESKVMHPSPSLSTFNGAKELVGRARIAPTSDFASERINYFPVKDSSEMIRSQKYYGNHEIHTSPNQNFYFGATQSAEGDVRHQIFVSAIESYETKLSPNEQNQVQHHSSLASFKGATGLAEQTRTNPTSDFASQGKKPSLAIESSEVVGAPKIVGEQPSADLTVI